MMTLIKFSLDSNDCCDAEDTTKLCSTGFETCPGFRRRIYDTSQAMMTYAHSIHKTLARQSAFYNSRKRSFLFLGSMCSFEENTMFHRANTAQMTYQKTIQFFQRRRFLDKGRPCRRFLSASFWCLFPYNTFSHSRCLMLVCCARRRISCFLSSFARSRRPP